MECGLIWQMWDRIKRPFKKVIKSVGTVNMSSHTEFLLDSNINPV